MPKLIVTDREGATHELDGPVGWSVMEVIRENNLPIEAACGGCCACATCHVYVAEEPRAALAASAPAAINAGHFAKRGHADERATATAASTSAAR